MQKNMLPPMAAESYLPAINEVSRSFSSLMLTNKIPINDLIPRFTFEVIGSVLFGKRIG